jgi:rhamnulokinase
MPATSSFAAIDLGASSGRVILGRVSAKRIEYEEVHRFVNGPVGQHDDLHWDVNALKENVFQGLSKLAQVDLESVGVDSWAVDYALIDSSGQMLRSPLHYRNNRNLRGVDSVHSKISPSQLFSRNGLQFLPFNSLYQFAVDQDEQASLLDNADRALLIPDLFNFWLSGVQRSERTNASTTGLLDPLTLEWDLELSAQLGLQQRLLAPVVAEGEYLGAIRSQVQELTKLNPKTKVVTVGSHDTASAFVAVPSISANSLFISSGTWSLIGVELQKPILTEEAFAANFTNECGVDGRTRFLKNVTGLWLAQECIREWRERGRHFDLKSLIESASQLSKRSVVDVNDPRFSAPGDVPARIQEFCRETDQWVPNSEVEVMRVIFDSLVAKYLEVIVELETLTGISLERIHIVGGGSQNALLNQLISDATGLEVFAGPVEATAIGNLVVQARTAGLLNGTLEDVREIIAENLQITKYNPNPSGAK